MRDSSTGLAISEESDQTEDWMPVITDQQETSANLFDFRFDTSNSAVSAKSVRSRVRPNDSDQSSLEQSRARFEVLKNWEGVVTTVENNTFFASMRLTTSDNKRPDAEFEIEIDNVPEGDRELVCDGAVFYLTVGVLRPRGEGPQKTTRLIFRRMPRWSPEDIARGEAEAADLWGKLRFGLESQETATDSQVD